MNMKLDGALYFHLLNFVIYNKTFCKWCSSLTMSICYHKCSGF